MKTTKLILGLLFTLNYFSSKAQLYFQNNTSEPVLVAIGKWVKNEGAGNWYSSGWTQVDPGDVTQVYAGIGYASVCYYYAETTSGKKYEGNVNFLVDRDNGFEIKNADKEYQKDANPNYTWTKFRKFVYETDFLGDTKVKQTIVLDY